jgi:hypothetical protein
MPRNKNTQPQEVAQMEQREFTVSLTNGKTGTANVDQHGGVLLNNGSFTESHSFQSLLNKARRNALPEWVSQLPNLAARIERVFAEEQKQGIDPFTQYSNADGRLIVTDLRSGTSLSSQIVDLKKLVAAGKPLPKAFSSPRAKELLSLAA